MMAAPPPETSGRSGHIPTLDGWRAVAILLVLLFHLREFIRSGPLAIVAKYGAWGVPIFFGISGFLICSRLADEIDAGRLSLRRFYIRRVFRILPPYFAYLGFLALLAAAGLLVIRKEEWLSCLFFYRNYLPRGLGGWYTGHFWSLAIEEHFYILMPAVLAIVGPRRARGVFVALCLAVAAWRVGDTRFHIVDQQMLNVDPYSRTDRQLDSLLWGCVIALVWREERWRAAFQRWLTTPAWIALFLAFTFFVIRPRIYSMAGTAFIIPLLLVGTIVRPGAIVSRILETGIMKWLGRLSYSLYIWQQFFLVRPPEARLSWATTLQFPPLSIVFAFAAALCSYHLIERPMIRVGQRVAGRVKVRSAA
jgi:peptidoglycan/LPS O-acetylase OafA/YrhL